MKLHVCAPDIFSGDAVGNHCLGVARMAEGLGWDVEVYAQRFDVSARAVHKIDDLFVEVTEDDTLLLSYSIFDPYLDALLELPCRKVCYFHGITEPGLLRAFEPKTAELCELAIGQLPKLAKFDIVIANSKHTAQSLAPYVDAASILVIPPVFPDMPAFTDVPRQRSRSGHAINLLVIGRVVPHKCIEDAIDVLAHLVERDIDASVSVVGTMPNYDYTKFLLNHARGLGVLGRIDFSGVLDDADLSDSFEKASALLSPSRHEGFCVPALEAMYRGIPAFVRDGHAAAEVVGFPELVFAEAADTISVAKAVEEILTNDRKLAELKPLVERRARELLHQSDPEFWLRALNKQATR